MRAPILWFAELAHHPCTRMVYRTYSESRARENEFMNVEKVYWSCRRDVWCLKDRVEVDEKAGRAVRRVLEAAGRDWETESAEMMDARDDRGGYGCLRGAMLVHHTLKAHFGDSRVAWERISPDDAAVARVLEAIEATKRGYLTPGKQKLWKCVRCRDTTHDRGRMTWEELKTHFTHNPKHGDPDEMEGKEEVTYYRALDYSERERPPVKMVPQKVES
ncbi:hypothetical protein NLJ89_g8104 [Agrocybe chaxingu]|uniref:Uncharacterized protein n=1 Tax=Agrocybe chaxingu TaxID=84603 RepID=A0A9W8JT92_9AGAR|nr:hypothetical protein NLJ89_g8104 [Agrocybe chaxingu]